MGFCLRVIVNEKHLNLEKTTSICIVINLNCDLVIPLGLILRTSMRKENLPCYISEILNSSFIIAFMIENKYFKQRQTLSSSIWNQANHELPRVCELRPKKIMHVANSVIILVSILCISINNILTLYNILTLFIMTRPVYSGQVNFYLLINKLVPYQSFT